MSADFTPSKPDFTVSAMDKDNDQVLKGVVGVAWKQPNGSIRLRLNPFVVLDTREHDLVITLFPVGQQVGKPPAKKSYKQTTYEDDWEPTSDKPPPF